MHAATTSEHAVCNCISATPQPAVRSCADTGTFRPRNTFSVSTGLQDGASEVTTLQRYTNVIITVLLIFQLRTFTTACITAVDTEVIRCSAHDLTDGSLYIDHVFCLCLSFITGSAVALHCCKAHAKSIGKMGNSTPCKIVTPENIILKLCIRD